MALKFNPFSGTFDYVQDFTAPTFVAPVTITGVVGSSALTITGATQTASFPALSITQTWNNAGVTFTGIKANFTNTASAAASNVLDLQVGGSTVMKVGRSGSINVPLATNSSSIAIIGGNNPASALYDYFGLLIGTKYWATGTSGFRAASDMSIGWDSATAVTNNSPDLYLYRDAAGVLAQRNSTNAQAFRLYNTYTDASNYERLTFDFSSGTARIYHEKAGTGSVRSVTFLNGSGSTALGIPGAVTGLITMAQGTVTSAVAGRVYIGENVTATSGNHYTLNVGETANPSSTSTMAYVSARIAPTINYSNATPGAGSYEALKIAVTETALPTGTNYLIRASAGAAGTTDIFNVLNTGDVGMQWPNATSGRRAWKFVASGTSITFQRWSNDFGSAQSGIWRVTNAVTNDTFEIQAGCIEMGSAIFLGWNGGANGRLYGEASNTIAQRVGTNAQTFNIYNTYTDASNYERLAHRWNSNVYEVAALAAGTGTLRGIRIGVTGNSVGFFGATPVAQPTTAGAAATFTANAGTAVNDASTFDGYTLNQIVKALRNIGLLA